MSFDPVVVPDLVGEVIGLVLSAMLYVSLITIGLYFVIRWWIGK